jgi:rubrerythrin
MRIRQALVAATALVAVAVPTSAARAGGAAAPVSPGVSVSPAARPVTQLLIDAAKTESFAYQAYNAYADAAAKGGHPALADVWRIVAEVEYQDHWTREVTLAGYYSGSDNAANLKTLIAVARQNAHGDETTAAEAPKGSAAATVLRAAAVRETADARLLTQALRALSGDGSMPAPPPIETVPIRMAPKPHYSGAFGEHLTSDSDSALEAAAWIWAGYHWSAKVATETGQADLAKLLAGLDARAQHQTLPELFNVAGFVNDDMMNLRGLFADEKEAIDMYTRYAAEARRAGASAAVISAFRNFREDEMGHRQVFSTELRRLGGRK